MRFVVDASVAIKWLVAEEQSDIADRLLDGSHELFAPRLMASEVGNALWRKVRVGEIEPRQAGELAAAIPALPVGWAEDDELSADALRIAISLERPAYACTYLALAHSLSAKLITADAHFASSIAATEHGGTVITLVALMGGE